MISNTQPIGVFDSGMGGLTVLKELSLGFPNEDFIYLGDSARLPYGTKSPKTIANYLKQNIQYLLQHKVKAIVVACNSASTQLLAGPAQWQIPIYNVIGPGAKAAAEVSINKCIGILGTTATVSDGAYVNALAKLDKNIKVFQIAAPLLVPLVEENWLEDPITKLIAQRYLSPLAEKSIDTLIMGCTHYPLLTKVFKTIVGPSVNLVDSAKAIAADMAIDLNQAVWSANKPEHTGCINILTTDLSPGIKKFSHKILNPIHINKIEAIDL